MPRLLAAILFICAIPSLSSAQAFDPAAATAAVIGEAHAEAYFEQAPKNGFARAIHIATKLPCAWGRNNKARIIVFDSRSAPGEDVGCSLETPFGNHTLYATRFGTPVTVDAALDFAILAIRAKYPEAKATTPEPDSSPWASAGPQMPPYRTAQFIVPDGKDQFMTRVTVAQIDGWIFKLRYTGPVGFDTRADVVWFSAIYEMLKERGMSPIKSVGEVPPSAQ